MGSIEGRTTESEILATHGGNFVKIVVYIQGDQYDAVVTFWEVIDVSQKETERDARQRNDETQRSWRRRGANNTRSSLRTKTQFPRLNLSASKCSREGTITEGAER